jgi:putative transposase
MNQPRTGSPSVHKLEVPLVWSTKYRYQVLTGDVHLRCRDVLRQTCNALDGQLLKGGVSKDPIQLHVSYPPSLGLSELMRRLKGRSAKLLLQEFPELKRRYWGGHVWGIGYGAWSVGNITDELVEASLNHHKDQPNGDENFILE